MNKDLRMFGTTKSEHVCLQGLRKKKTYRTEKVPK